MRFTLIKPLTLPKSSKYPYCCLKLGGCGGRLKENETWIFFSLPELSLSGFVIKRRKDEKRVIKEK